MVAPSLRAASRGLCAAALSIGLTLGASGAAAAPPAFPPPAGRHFLAELVASSFFRGLLEGHLAAIAPLCARRVNFDGRWVEGRQAQRSELLQLVQRAQRSGLKLRGVWILSLAEMVARFGPAPLRLQAALRPGDLVALARFDRLGALAALRREGRFYRIHLLTD